MSTACLSHHHACACREHRVAVLKKAAWDAAFELDEVKLLASISQEERGRLQAIVDRAQSACETLGEPVDPVCAAEEETHL